MVAINVHDPFRRPKRGYAQPLSPEQLEHSVRLAAIHSAYCVNGATNSFSIFLEGLIPEMHSVCVQPHSPGAKPPEGDFIALIAPSFTGKSQCISMVENHPMLQDHFQGEFLVKPMISISAPSPCTLRTLGHELLNALGWVGRYPSTQHMVWHHVRHLLIAYGVMIVVIDEFQQSRQR